MNYFQCKIIYIAECQIPLWMAKWMKILNKKVSIIDHPHLFLRRSFSGCHKLLLSINMITFVILFTQIAWETPSILITSQLQYFQTCLKIFQGKYTSYLIKRTIPSENYDFAFFVLNLFMNENYSWRWLRREY